MILHSNHMNDFLIVDEQITGDIFVTQDTQFNNIDANQITIAANVKVRLYGTAREVILRPGSSLYLHGKIYGNIHNEGGEVFTFFG